MALKNTQTDVSYISVLADGHLHMTVPEGTEGAVQRDYETSDGKTGTKHELIFTEVSGLITDIAFHEGEYGKSLQITITDGEEKPVVLSLSTAQNFGEDMMKKLLAIKLDTPVRLVPYSLVDGKTSKTKKGITVYQLVNGVETKIQNYFYDAEKKTNLHGYPEVPAGHGKKPVSTDEWKLYFMTARIFMIGAIEKAFKIDATKEDITADF